MTTTPTAQQIHGDTLQDMLDQHIDGSINSSTGAGIEIDDATGQVNQYSYGRTRRLADNIGTYLDSTLKTKNKIQLLLDNAEHLRSPATPAETFNNFADIYTQISTGLPLTGTPPTPPTHIAHKILAQYLDSTTFSNVHNLQLSPDKTQFIFDDGVVPPSPSTVDIIPMCEELYLDRKIEIRNLSRIAAILHRAQTAQERATERAARNVPTALTGIPENPSTTPSASTNSATTLNEELSIPQLYAACEQAQKKPNQGSAYSFDKKWFFVRYNGADFPPNPDTTPPNTAAKFQVQYQKKDGTTGTAVGNTVGEMVASISTLAEKKETLKSTAETVDMGNEFSQSVFLTLCEDVSKSKSKRGVYKLGGKEYIVAETTPAGTGGTPPAFYNAQYLGHTNTISNHTSGAQDLSQYLKENIHFHAHTEGSHVFSKKGFTDLCEHLAGAPNQRGLYEFEGQQYPIWIEGGTLYGNNYHAEIPGEGGRTSEISAGSPEKLYEKILKKAHKNHAEEKKEGKEKADEKGSETKADDKAGHPEEHPEEKGGTKYDKVVNTIFGNGLIGKVFKGVRNVIPKGVRGLSGAAFDGVIAGGVVGGGLYLTSAAIGSAAIGTFVIPAATAAFAGYGIYSAVKRFNKWRASRGGGESKESKGGH